MTTPSDSEIQEDGDQPHFLISDPETYSCWEVVDMAESVKKVCESDVGLTDEEKKLISDECERAIKERQGSSANPRAYRFNEFAQILHRLNSAPSSSAGESTISYHILEGDYMRYVATFKKGKERKELVDRSFKAYEDAKRAAADMPPTHPIRLGLALKFSVFCNELLQSQERAFNIAKEAFDEVKTSLELTSNSLHQDSHLIVQLLREKLILWCYDKRRKTSVDRELEDEPIEEVNTGSLMILMWIACLGGLVLGYNMSVPGLVMLLNDYLMDGYHSHLHIKAFSYSDAYCKRTDLVLMLLSSITGITAFAFRIVGPMLSRRWGSRIILQISLGTILVGLSIMCTTPLAFVPASVTLGIGLGVTHLVIQMYVYEASSKSSRDDLDWYFSVSVMIGVVFASVMSSVFSNTYTHIGWRLPLLVGVVPVVVLLITSLIIYIDVGEFEKSRHPFVELFKSNHRPALVISVVSQIFSTLCGSAAFTMIMPKVFEDLQLPKTFYYAYSVVNVLVTLFGIATSKFLFRQFGKKFVLLLGIFLGTGCLVLISCILRFYKSGFHTLSRAEGILTLIMMSTNVIVYIWCFGPIGWLSSSYPEKILWTGVSLSSSTNLAFVIVFSFVLGELFCKLRGLTFLVFIPINVIMFAFICLFVPESNKIKRKDMVKIWNKHWYWKKYTIQEKLEGRNNEDA